MRNPSLPLLGTGSLAQHCEVTSCLSWRRLRAVYNITQTAQHSTLTHTTHLQHGADDLPLAERRQPPAPVAQARDSRARLFVIICLGAELRDILLAGRGCGSWCMFVCVWGGGERALCERMAQLHTLHAACPQPHAAACGLPPAACSSRCTPSIIQAIQIACSPIAGSLLMCLLRSSLNAASSSLQPSDTPRPATLPLRSSCTRFMRQPARRPSPAETPLQNAGASALQGPGAAGGRR